MNNTREEVVKNIMRRGLLDNKYVNKVLERKAGVIYGSVSYTHLTLPTILLV